MQGKTLPSAAVLAALLAGAMALTAAGCSNNKSDDSYEGKIKANDSEGTAGTTGTSGKNPRVVLKTSMGNITVELFADKAPISTKNFLRYVKDRFYDGTIFHRVISSFMIQGGGFTPDMQKKPTRGPIRNEATNGLHNLKGTLAMARTPMPDSATAQFFINVKKNPQLDHRGPGRAFGYAVFGKVVDGMDVVERIRKVETTTRAGRRNVPVKPVVILQARLQR